MPTGLKESKEKEQSLIAALVYAALVALLGVLLGMFYMLGFPLQSFSSMAEQAESMEGRESLEPIPADAFYIEGPVLRSRSWEGKRAQFLEGGGGSLVITAGEINAWLASKFRPASGSPQSESEDGFVLLPKEPNVALTEDNVFYVNLPTEVVGYGFDGEYVLSATGEYSEGAPAKFAFHSFRFGSAKVPLPGFLGGRFLATFFEGFGQFEEFKAIQEAWNRVEAVEIADGGLKFSLL